ncbi:MAG TPA: hypothetical protein VGN07_12780 [Steroidobacteraceae bacterium]
MPAHECLHNHPEQLLMNSLKKRLMNSPMRTPLTIPTETSLRALAASVSTPESHT